MVRVYYVFSKWAKSELPKLIGLFFSAVSREKIKNLQRSEQAHFLVSRLDSALAATPLALVLQCEPAHRLVNYH